MLGTSDTDVAVVLYAQDMFDGRRSYSDSDDTRGGGDVLEARGGCGEGWRVVAKRVAEGHAGGRS